VKTTRESILGDRQICLVSGAIVAALRVRCQAQMFDPVLRVHMRNISLVVGGRYFRLLP
jgi:hypothetical protein